MKKIAALSLALVLLAALAACAAAPGNTTASPDKTDSAGLTLVLTGLANGEIKLTVADAKTFPVVSTEVTSVNSSGTEKKMKVTGAKLSDILTKNGYAQKDFSTITTKSSDGYAIDIPAEIIAARDILLVYEVDGEACDLRSIIPDERAMYWGKMLVEMSFKTGGDAASAPVDMKVAQVISINTAAATREKTPFEYKDASDEALAIEGWIAEVATVGLIAADGLEKTMEWEDFGKAFLKVTGDAVPYLGAPDMSKGMTVKELAVIKAGADVYFDLPGVLKLTGDKAACAEILTYLGLPAGDTYVFTGADGYAVEISSADLTKGSFSLTDDGQLKVSFDGLAKNTTVKGLLSVTLK